MKAVDAAEVSENCSLTQNSETAVRKPWGNVSNLRPWRRGQSGNPGGRPKTKLLRERGAAGAEVRVRAAEAARRRGPTRSLQSP